MLENASRHASATRLPSALVSIGLAASLLGVMVTTTAMAVQPAPSASDPCAVDISQLGSRDRTFAVRRTIACSDITHGRISQAEYRQQIAAIDKAWAAAPAPAPPVTQWASSVRGVSTQYTETQWAAHRVLGAPDVFPVHGDNANAWASLGADDRNEWIEVGYAQPMRISAVEVYETYNPGAVSSIELITASGERINTYLAIPGARGAVANKLRADVGCTVEPIVAVKVELASTQVAGWNELDAIGVVPCVE